MRKLVLILIAFFAVVTFMRAFTDIGNTAFSAGVIENSEAGSTDSFAGSIR